jgi:hypothetical protein
MYKNFILTESEREEILNMHKSHGYKNVINEAVAEEPVINTDMKPLQVGVFGFKEGGEEPTLYNDKPVSKNLRGDMANAIANYLKKTGAYDTLKKFRNSPNFQIPQFIEMHIRTSQTGSGKVNAQKADARMGYMQNLILDALRILSVDAAVAKSIVINKPVYEYAPSQIDRNFNDPNLSQPNPKERECWMIIKPLTTKGNTIKGIQNIQKGLNSASSMLNTWVVDGVDEARILQELNKMQSFSDVEDLNDSIIAGGKFDSLEGFLNDQLWDDPKQMNAAAVILQKLAMVSGKQKNTVRIVGKKISIGFGE